VTALRGRLTCTSPTDRDALPAFELTRYPYVTEMSSPPRRHALSYTPAHAQTQKGHQPVRTPHPGVEDDRKCVREKDHTHTHARQTPIYTSRSPIHSTCRHLSGAAPVWRRRRSFVVDVTNPEVPEVHSALCPRRYSCQLQWSRFSFSLFLELPPLPETSSSPGSPNCNSSVSLSTPQSHNTHIGTLSPQDIGHRPRCQDGP